MVQGNHTYHFEKNHVTDLFVIPWLIKAAQYKPVSNRPGIKFTIKNFGVAVNGTFTGLKGNVLFDAAYPERAAFDISINARTINTGNDFRDSLLGNEDYFDTERYPEISFVSTKVARSGKNEMLTVYGKLTIKNSSKEISFPFSAETIDNGYLFKGMFLISRKDFQIGGAGIAADNVEITLDVSAIK